MQYSIQKIAKRYLKAAIAAVFTEHEGERFWGSAGAGMLLVNGGKMLLLKRSSHVEQPHTWGIPGGAAEMPNPNMQDLWATAQQETMEETKARVSGKILERHTFRKGGFFYTTFIVEVPTRPTITLNWESSDSGWFTFEEASQLPLHFGVKWVFGQSTALKELFVE